MKELQTVVIKGTERPVLFCTRVYRKWMLASKIDPRKKDLNKSLMEAVNDPDKMYRLIWMALQHAGKAVNKPFRMTEEAFGFMLDMDETLYMELIDLFAESTDTGIKGEDDEETQTVEEESGPKK